MKTANNNYVVSANQKVNSTQNDFKTTCLNGNVVSVWQQMYNANTKKAFTTATTSDALGNIYVAGSTYINGTNGQDLTVMKYNSAGLQQWVKHYNGPGNNYDIASGIVVDNAGNVYVTGASVGLFFALVDYVTIKFNSAGTQQWATRYNFSNGIDIPAGITLDNSGNVIVSGSSASSSINNNWDFATVKYNASTGVQMQVQRQTNTGNAQDKLIAQTKDNNGNIYTTGITSSNGTNFDVQTIKYDQNMNVIWVKTFDGYGKFDQGTDIAVDNVGNVIVTGYATRNNLTKELLVLSYSSNGNLNFKTLKQPLYDASNAEGIKVNIKSANEIFIGGNYTTSGNQDMVILRFDSRKKQLRKNL
ncbi:MAG: SBBP repeat-containing protein [Bacteroidota bacterium]